MNAAVNEASSARGLPAWHGVAMGLDFLTSLSE